MITRKVKRKKIIIILPEIMDVLDDNFSYSKYIEDVIALNNEIYQGYFKCLEGNMKLTEEEFLRRYSYSGGGRDELYESYRKEIETLQKIYEDNYKTNPNIDKIITDEMKQTAQAYLNAFDMREKTRK